MEFKFFLLIHCLLNVWKNCGSIEASPSTWKTFSCNLYTAIEKYSWGNPQDYLRIDLGGDKDVMIYLRDIRLRGMNSVEQEP